MAGQHTIWDHSLKNIHGSDIDGGLAVCFGDEAESCVLPANADVYNFAGISTHKAGDEKPLALRRLGTVLVKASGAVTKGKFARIAGTNGRLEVCPDTGTPEMSWAVGMFEEDGVDGDLVCMTVIYPAMQVEL